MVNEYSYQEVMETAKRMHETYSCLPGCAGCPMKGTNIAHCRKVAFEHPEKFSEIVMGWGEEHQFGVNEFSADQERQIDAVMNAAEELIRGLRIVYLICCASLAISIFSFPFILKTN